MARPAGHPDIGRGVPPGKIGSRRRRGGCEGMLDGRLRRLRGRSVIVRSGIGGADGAVPARRTGKVRRYRGPEEIRSWRHGME